MARVALVTGANRGIGLEIVRQLCKKFEGKVLLAARSASLGREAVARLESEGLKPELLMLDVCSDESIRSASEEVTKRFGRLDVLINNAGVLFRTGLSTAESARQTMAVNYFGTLNVTNTFLPLLQPNSRIIHMSSTLGHLREFSVKIRSQITSPGMTVDKLSTIMQQFVTDAQSPDYDSKGWPASSGQYFSYTVSKVGVCYLAHIQGKAFASDASRPGILVNAVHPGWVATRMGTEAATTSVEDGADSAVYLALLPPGTDQPNGEFIRDRNNCIMLYH